MLAERGHEIRLMGTVPPREVLCRGARVPFAKDADTATAPYWHFDGRTLTTVVVLPHTPTSEPTEVIITPSATGADADALTRGFAGRIRRLEASMRTLKQLWPCGWSPDELVEAVQTPRRIELAPARALDELLAFDRRTPAIAEAIRQAEADASRAVQQLGGRREAESVSGDESPAPRRSAQPGLVAYNTTIKRAPRRLLSVCRIAIAVCIE